MSQCIMSRFRSIAVLFAMAVFLLCQWFRVARRTYCAPGRSVIPSTYQRRSQYNYHRAALAKQMATRQQHVMRSAGRMPNVSHCSRRRSRRWRCEYRLPSLFESGCKSSSQSRLGRSQSEIGATTG